MPAQLFLIPTPIGSDPKNTENSLPPANRDIIDSLDYFVVENLRSARRFLAGLKLSRAIDDMLFAELNEHTPAEEVEALLSPLLKEGRSAGILSEAGLPCVADPGALLVGAAHRNGIEVVPLVGPSSLMLALMASGANGQSFAFNGYLPVKQPERGKMIRFYEKQAITAGQSQIFIETPYRNVKLWEEFTAVCSPSTKLTVAAGLTEADEFISTRTIAEWKRAGTPNINKRPAIFILFF